MASNPNRPQYQGTIESTWGQSVADHVIRRYATTAARDADLAVLAPADLEGQVVAITGAGRVPFLELMSSGVWRGPSGFDIQAGVDARRSRCECECEGDIPSAVRRYAGRGVERCVGDKRQ